MGRAATVPSYGMLMAGALRTLHTPSSIYLVLTLWTGFSVQVLRRHGAHE